MNPPDVIRFSSEALTGYPVRSSLTLLATAIGVASVVLLTALGEGARLYVDDQFRSLGSNLLVVLPGRSETTGGPPPLLGETPRDLTLGDALALERCRSVLRVAPVSFGMAPASFGNREREVTVLGTTSEMLEVRHLRMAYGRFLPPGDADRSRPVCVIGPKVKEELFGGLFPLGKWLRIGDRRFRVIGVLSSEGRSLGLDLHEVVLVPVASAMAIFDTASLFRVVVEARSPDDTGPAQRFILDTIRSRHEGEDDITVITQDAVLSTLNRVLRTLTVAVGGIAGISLSIAGILIMNVLLISVSERRAEIGLLKALGSSRGQIVRLFLSEAVFLAAAGGILGLGVGHSGAAITGWLYPFFPVSAPLWASVAGLGLAVGAGALFGTLPALRAADLDPVAALSRR